MLIERDKEGEKKLDVKSGAVFVFEYFCVCLAGGKGYRRQTNREADKRRNRHFTTRHGNEISVKPTL